MAGLFRAYIKWINIFLLYHLLAYRTVSAQFCLKRFVGGKWITNGNCKGSKTVAHVARLLESSKSFKVPVSDKLLQECYLGMKSRLIPDTSITASSMFDALHSPKLSRLDTQVYSGAGSWAARTNNKGEWLQIDLGAKRALAGIVTQGRPKHSQWVVSYTVSCGSDVNDLDDIAKDGKTLVFDGNRDMNTKVYNRFPTVMSCRYVRIYPQATHGWVSMRVELVSGECFYSANPFI